MELTREQSLKRPPAREAITPIGPSIAYIDLKHGVYALIDSDDAERISRRSWVAMRDRTGKIYAKRTTHVEGKGVVIMMHREILCVEGKGVHVDHRNSVGLDNRKCNIRAATRSQNMANRRMEGKNKGKNIVD